jgi:hypothetical protein
VSKADGTDFTKAEANDLMDALLAWFEQRGLGFGGGIGIPGMID